MFTLSAAIAACTPVDPVNGSCGDKNCNIGESHHSCAVDCPPPPICGDGDCAPSEHAGCAKDCAVIQDVCGDGKCTVAEMSSCATDCGALKPMCGDERCADAERSGGTCPLDCGGSIVDFCGNRISVSQEPVMLAVYAMRMACHERDWSAVGSMLGSFYGVYRSECHIASAKAGYDDGACCLMTSCTQGSCDAPANGDDVSNMLRDDLGLRGVGLERGLDESELQIELSNGRPVIIALDSSAGTRYAIVAGFSGQRDGVTATYTVIDPYYGTIESSHHSIVYGAYGTGPLDAFWARSWYRLAPESDGCNPSYDEMCGCE